MYDLCTRPEQPEPASADMESHKESDVPERMPQELRGSEELGANTAANTPSASSLGKKHHSLYANLNGFEEGIRKVRMCVKRLYIGIYYHQQTVGILCDRNCLVLCVQSI